MLIGILIYFDYTRIFGFILLAITTFLIMLFLSCSTNKTTKDTADVFQQIERHKLALAAAEKKIASVVLQHLDTLADRRDTLVRVDRYGVVDGKDWSREVQHFIDNVVRPKLTAEEAEATAAEGISSVFQRLLEDPVAEHCARRNKPAQLPENITPLDFEGLCASILREHGWSASTTKGSGDQGADVIAEKEGRRLVLQCKLHSGTVGNKSVQEVLAAKHFYGADLAAVVSRTDFTKSAKQLAQVAGVHMLTYTELSSFAEVGGTG